MVVCTASRLYYNLKVSLMNIGQFVQMCCLISTIPGDCEPAQCPHGSGCLAGTGRISTDEIPRRERISRQQGPHHSLLTRFVGQESVEIANNNDVMIWWYDMVMWWYDMVAWYGDMILIWWCDMVIVYTKPPRAWETNSIKACLSTNYISTNNLYTITTAILHHINDITFTIYHLKILLHRIIIIKT